MKRTTNEDQNIPNKPTIPKLKDLLHPLRPRPLPRLLSNLIRNPDRRPEIQLNNSILPSTAAGK